MGILGVISRIQNHLGSEALYTDNSMIEHTKVFRYNEAQTNTEILQPPVGYKLCVRAIRSNTEANAGTIKVDFVTSNQAVYDHYAEAMNASQGFNRGHIVGSIGEPLTINTTTGSSGISISITYTYHK